MVAALVASLWVSASLGASVFARKVLLQDYPAMSPLRLQEVKRDPQLHASTAVIALGAGVHPVAPEYGEPNLTSESLERLRYAIWLARELEVPAGFSGGLGWAASESTGTSEAAIAQRIATAEFKHPLRWVEGRSRDTRENARETVALLRLDGIRRIVVVTSALHMPRAMAAFRLAASGQDLVLESAPIGAAPSSRSAVFDWLPSAEGTSQFRAVMREWLWALGGA